MPSNKLRFIIYQIVVLVLWDYLWLLQHYPVVPRSIPLPLMLLLLMPHLVLAYSITYYLRKKRLNTWQKHFLFNLHILSYLLSLTGIALYRCLVPSENLIVLCAVGIALACLSLTLFIHLQRTYQAMLRKTKCINRFYGCAQ